MTATIHQFPSVKTPEKPTLPNVLVKMSQNLIRLGTSELDIGNEKRAEKIWEIGFLLAALADDIRRNP